MTPLERCDAEIAAIAEREDITLPGSALLSTLGRLDWEAEKRLIEAEAE